MFFCGAKSRLWPATEVTRRPRFGRDRVKSGHNSDIAEVKRVTHLRSGGCIAAVETMSILAAGEEPSPATQRITPRAFALPVQSNGLLRQEIVD
jgi:hypothetical protein